MEVRSLRTQLNQEGRKLVGYAALYNSPSHVISERGRKFVEVIAPNAFARTLKDHPDITAHWSHDEDARPPLGRTTAGTLQLESDGTGLRFSLDLPDWASDIKESVARGDVSGMSFQFVAERDSWEQRDGQTVRTLHDITLQHIAVVVRPAYPEAFAQVRSKVEPPEQHTLKKLRLLLAEKTIRAAR